MINKILVTGAAGFVGFHLCKRLCKENYNVFGVDNLNNYYDVKLKNDRLKNLNELTNFQFEKIDLIERDRLFSLFKNEKFDIVINLAAQAGVRYSIENPFAYLDSNLIGFLNLIEASRKYPLTHFIFASSSSVYGANKKIPFSEKDFVDNPISLYAATKKSNELIAYTYSHLYSLPCTGLRFFTVYGPFGRPDMAYYKFVKSIFEGRPIDVYNNGKMKRDFTYIDDIVESIFRILFLVPSNSAKVNNSNEKPVQYDIFNIGNNQPVNLMHFIKILEKLTNKRALINFLDMQPGDVEITYANIDKLSEKISYKPQTSIEDGLKLFVDWYRSYYIIKS